MKKKPHGFNNKVERNFTVVALADGVTRPRPDPSKTRTNSTTLWA